MTTAGGHTSEPDRAAPARAATPRLWPLLVGGLVIAVGAGAVMTRARRAAELPRWGAIPSFRFTDQTGQPFGSDDLHGPAVFDFIFTSCPEVCPRMTGEMAKLRTHLANRGLAGRVLLVSVSVDPGTDTPEKLAAYAARFHADPAAWRFLTGPAGAVEDAVVRGFHVALQRDPDGTQDNFAILHGTKLVLVDAERQIRGYYDSDDEAALGKLRRDAEALAQGGR